MQSDLHAVISGDSPVVVLRDLQVEEAVLVAKHTELAKLADLVADTSPKSLLEQKVADAVVPQVKVTLAAAIEPASEFTGISKPYAHLRSYESALEEDPSSYTKVYSKPTSTDAASQEMVELSPDLDFDEIQNYVRTSSLQRLGYAVAQVSDEAKKQWQTFTASIEGFCWSVLMYDMAR